MSDGEIFRILGSRHSMNLETTRARLARRPAFNVKRELYFAFDAIVICLIFAASSYATWGSLRVWADPEVMLPAAVIVIVLPLIKTTVLRNETDQIRRLAKLQLGILVAYALIATYLVFSRGYYSRYFLLSSFGMVMFWQFVDTLFISSSLRPQLVAVPSNMIDRIRLIQGSNLSVLHQPVLNCKADGVVVDLHEKLEPEWHRFIAECAASGVQVYHAAAIYESLTGRIPLSHTSETSILEFVRGRNAYRRVKRILDILAVLIALPLVLPLSLILSVVIKMDSPGPVLYWQERVGERGVPFRMVKFRSMRTDAEANGAMFASSEDPRITRVGRITRKYRLDEIPQLWNVLKGEMSIIGPRPEQVTFARAFEKEIPFYAWRHYVKPGITGWAQVQDGYAADVEDTRRKTEYDLYYVKHFSFWLDLSIVIRTIRTVLTGSGAR